MRRHAVFLTVAAAWLIGIEGAEARLDILVDKATQRMLVIQDGYVRYMWPVSTGRDELATPNGVYSPQRMERNWFSRAYYNSPMPYSIFFHNGYAIHGSYAIDQLGGPASHGCVRLHPHHAALLFELVQQEGPDKTTIEITDQPRPDEPQAASRDIPPPREIAMGQGPYPQVPSREALPPREFAMGQGSYPQMPPREGMPPREFAMGQGSYPQMPPREGMPPREFAVGQGSYPQMPPREGMPPREFAMGQGSYPQAPPREVLPPRTIAMGPGSYPSASPRDILASREIATDPPPIVRYRPPVELAELSPSQRGVRPAAPRTVPPSKPAIGQRMVTDLKLQANTARTPCGPGEAAKQGSDCRPKAKLAEAPSPEQTPQTQQPQHAQAEKAVYGFKLLPASCWSGGATRWRWWGGGREAACK